MTTFLGENFLLQSDFAQSLYFNYAEKMPIYDYHSHISPIDLANNRSFSNLTEIWLNGDHYKWRAMRMAGIDENLITGNANDYDKYMAFAKTVPLTIGNPLYHWVHLELKRPFGYKNIVFNEDLADKVWNETKDQLITDGFRAQRLMEKMNVAMIGTTDDPTDDLKYHKQLNDEAKFKVKVRPSFRPDKAFKIELDGFNDYIKTLSEVSNVEINSFENLMKALISRLEYFVKNGCLATDHGIEILRFHTIPNNAKLDEILSKRLRNKELTLDEIAMFTTAVLVHLGREYKRLNLVMQLHIGPIRNNNTRMFKLLGPDSGFDSIGDNNIANNLSKLLDGMDATNELPKTILYCLNPRDNEVMVTMAGNFCTGSYKEPLMKVQFGSAWWFNDQKDGMTRQIEQLSSMGLLSLFVGMLTDSRSLLSYTRHEYFRRLLCNIIATWVTNGEAPNDEKMLGKMVENICFNNALYYFENIH